MENVHRALVVPDPWLESDCSVVVVIIADSLLIKAVPVIVVVVIVAQTHAFSCSRLPHTHEDAHSHPPTRTSIDSMEESRHNRTH